MRRPWALFFGAMNQAAKSRRSSFRFRHFKEAPQMLRVLVDEGYVQYYQKEGQHVQVRLRKDRDGVLVKEVLQVSKSSMPKFVKSKSIKWDTRLNLIAAGGKIMKASDCKRLNVGGEHLAIIR
mmetsp:Transcript_6089/g.8460  ORF Transcript_6089/g.8460 Transcript_6089/m.8460 type:complete len:123 (-) Transcript_6089:41-409(-)